MNFNINNLLFLSVVYSIGKRYIQLLSYSKPGQGNVFSSRKRNQVS